MKKPKSEHIPLYPLPPIPLSAIAVAVMEAVKKLHEYEAIHGPVSKRGRKKKIKADVTQG